MVYVACFYLCALLTLWVIRAYDHLLTKRTLINTNNLILCKTLDHALVCRMDNTSSPSNGTIVSAWKDGFGEDWRTCMSFDYRLVGDGTKMVISVETNATSKRVIWKVENPRNGTSGRYGRIFVGFLPKYRVSCHLHFFLPFPYLKTSLPFVILPGPLSRIIICLIERNAPSFSGLYCCKVKARG